MPSRRRSELRKPNPSTSSGLPRAKSRGNRARATGDKRSSPKPKKASPKRRRSATRVVAKTGNLTVTEVEELEELRRELERSASGSSPLRWNADPDDVQRSVAQLVLTLVEFIRRLMERQAIRRMEAGGLTDSETENIGRALMKLEETVRDIAAKFGIAPEELNLDLGPVGKLM
jgi:hypothetical protein